MQGGPYAALFDNVEDTLTFQRVQCFDFEGWTSTRWSSNRSVLCPPSRERRPSTTRTRPALKLFVLDEAWRFAEDPTLKAYITEALKTWRKRNAAMILATQSSEDFAAPDLLRTVVESCPTKFFLANPAMDLDRARQLFHLNQTEAARITTLLPRQQALLKRPDLAKVAESPRRPRLALDLHEHAERHQPTRHCRVGRIRRRPSPIETMPLTRCFAAARSVLALATRRARHRAPAT